MESPTLRDVAIAVGNAADEADEGAKLSLAAGAMPAWLLTVLTYLANTFGPPILEAVMAWIQQWLAAHAPKPTPPIPAG